MSITTIASASTALASIAAASTAANTNVPASLSACTSFVEGTLPSVTALPARLSAGIFSAAAPKAIAGKASTAEGVPMMLSAASTADPATEDTNGIENLLGLGGGIVASVIAIIFLVRFISRQAPADQRDSVVSDWQPDGEGKSPSALATAVQPKSAKTGTSIAPPKDTGHHHGGRGIH